MNDIDVEERLFEEIDTLIETAETLLTFRDLHATSQCTNAGITYLFAMHSEFSSLIENYLVLLKRDLGMFVDMAAAFMEYDDPTHSLSVTDVYQGRAYSSTISFAAPTFSYSPDFSNSDEWQFKKEDLNYISANVIEDMVVLISNLREYETAINSFCESDSFRGEAAYAAKDYFARIHRTIINGFSETAQVIISYVTYYWNDYIYHSLLQGEGETYAYYKPSIISYMNLVQDQIDSMRAIHSQFSESSEQFRNETSYVYDYSSIEPSLPPVTGALISLIDRADDIIAAVEGNESTFLDSYKICIEDSFQVLTSLLNDVLSNVQGRNDYYYPPADGQDPIGLDEYNSQINAIRAENEANNTEVICEGVTRAGGINREVARFNLEIQQRDQLIVDAGIVILSIIALLLSGGMGAPIIVQILGALIGVGQISFHSANAVEHAENLYDAANNNPGAGHNAFNTIRDIVFNGNQTVYDAVQSVFDVLGDIIIPGLNPNGALSSYEIIGRNLIVHIGSEWIEITLESIDNAVIEQLAEMGYEGGINTASENMNGGDTTFSEEVLDVDVESGFGLVETAIDLLHEEDMYTESYLTEDTYTEDSLRDMGVISC